MAFFNSARRLARNINWDPGLLVVGLLATLAVWPFITRTSLPTFTDAEMHAYRVYEIVAAWRMGVPYIRWAPDLFYAFGYPVFHYYAPLSYYVGAAYSALIGDNGVAGVKFVLVVSAYIGAWGMYLFVRDRWGALAGVVSAAAFIFAPYKIYIDPHARGDAPETLAIALVPFMFWAFARLRRTASPGDVVLASLFLAGVILSHNLMALVFFALLLAWLAWDVVFGQMFFGAWIAGQQPSNTTSRRQIIAALAVAVGLGLCLAAFMWLPAVLERDAVQYRNVASGTYFDFRRYFIEVGELFAPALTFDFGATQMRFNYSVGIAQWPLALAGILTVFSPRRLRLSVMFFAFAALAFVYLMLPASQEFWEAIPPLAFMQFPYRFLGPAAVALGVLAGAAVSWADSIPWRHAKLAVSAAAVAACITAALPLMYPPPWPAFGPLNAQRILETELNGRGIGTTSANDFLPVEVISVPGPQPALIASYAAGQPDRVNRPTLPAGTDASILETKPELHRFRVTGQTNFVLRLFLFYFPGWTAYVDGQPVAITPSEPEGWITFWVPPGDHEVVVRLENTWPRWLAWGLSALAALALGALVVWRLRLKLERPKHDPLPRVQFAVLSALICLGLGVRWVADQNGWWWVQSTGTQALVAQRPQVTHLQSALVFLAYDAPVTTLRPGDKLPLTLYWKALQHVPHNYRVFVHLIGPDGLLWGQSDKWNPADYPISRWPSDRYVWDEHNAALNPAIPPGAYKIYVGLWDGDTGARVPVVDERGQPTGADSILLNTTITVVP